VLYVEQDQREDLAVLMEVLVERQDCPIAPQCDSTNEKVNRVSCKSRCPAPVRNRGCIFVVLGEDSYIVKCA